MIMVLRMLHFLFPFFCCSFLSPVCQSIVIASSYIFPLTVVSDVETSFLEATVLDFLYVEKGSENGFEHRTNYKVCQHRETWEGLKKNVLVNNLAVREQFREVSSFTEWWCCLSGSVYLC